MREGRFEDIGISLVDIKKALGDTRLSDADHDDLYKNCCKLMRMFSFIDPDGGGINPVFFDKAWVLFALLGNFDHAWRALSKQQEIHPHSVFRLCAYCVLSGNLGSAGSALVKLKSDSRFINPELTKESNNIHHYAALSGSQSIIDLAADMPGNKDFAMHYLLLSGNADLAVSHFDAQKLSLSEDVKHSLLPPLIMSGNFSLISCLLCRLYTGIDPHLILTLLVGPELFPFVVLSRSPELVKHIVCQGFRPSTLSDALGRLLMANSARSIVEIVFRRAPPEWSAKQVQRAAQKADTNFTDKRGGAKTALKVALRSLDWLKYLLDTFPDIAKLTPEASRSVKKLELRVYCTTVGDDVPFTYDLLRGLLNRASAALRAQHVSRDGLFTTDGQSVFLKQLLTFAREHAKVTEESFLSDEASRIVDNYYSQSVPQANTQELDDIVATFLTSRILRHTFGDAFSSSLAPTVAYRI